MTAPIPPPASHPYNDDGDGGSNIVSSDTEADPKSVFFLFCQPTFLFEGKRSGWHPYLEMQPEGKGKLFSQFYILIQGVHPTQIWIQAQRAVGIPLT